MKKRKFNVGQKRDREIRNIYQRKKQKLIEEKFPILPEKKIEHEHGHEQKQEHKEYKNELEEYSKAIEKPFLTNISFNSLNILPELKQSIEKSGYTCLTEVQAKTLPKCLSGKDVFVESPTGSGKTLSFLIPIIDRCLKCSYEPGHGVCGLIITPTRELSLQVYHEANRLVTGLNMSCLCVIGGGNKLKESKRLNKGVNILIGTPGRLLDHLINTEFNMRNFKVIVLDEADRMLDHGFEMDVNSILYKIPKNNNFQCMLFSATNQLKVKSIAQKILKKNDFNVIKSSRSDDLSVVKNLCQGYLILDTDKKLMVLLTFFRRNRRKRIIVFFATCASVLYFSKLLGLLNIEVFQIHGELSQRKRNNNFEAFKNSQNGGILFSTNVCARGIDIKDVHWIIQYDPPNDLKDYVHRVGRTARAGKQGNAVLFLAKNEKLLLKEFEKLSIKLKQFKIGTKVLDIQAHVEELVEKNYYLLQLAHKTFQIKCYSYRSYPFKKIFSLKTIDLEGLARQFGLKKVPYIPFDER